MIVRLAALFLLSLAGCKEVLTKTAAYEPQKAGSIDQAMCQLGLTAVPLRELLTGHHLVEARLNGKPASFVVDTGANRTVLHAPFAGEFGLTGKPVGMGGAVGVGGSVKASQAAVETLAIGGMAIRQRRIMTTDLSQVTNLLSPISGSKVYGIIGQDVLKEHRAVIDVAKPILYLVREDKDPAPVPLERCTAAPRAEKAKAN
jgi:predicted aspartyl protease